MIRLSTADSSQKKEIKRNFTSSQEDHRLKAQDFSVCDVLCVPPCSHAKRRKVSPELSSSETELEEVSLP